MSVENYNIKKERFTIMNVDTVSKTEFLILEKELRNKYSNYPVFINRTTKSLLTEFCAHKVLYSLGIFKTKTKDAGMQYPLSLIEKISYSLFGWLFRILILT